MGVLKIDMRSDTVTKATPEMRHAMANAEVGDDVLQDDPTTIEFEKKAAELFGKESALFVPSGTMGNLIACLVHCGERGSEIVLGDQSHIHYYEQGGMAQIGGIHHRAITNKADGTFNLEELKSKIRIIDDDHFATTKLICLENTHNRCGGVVLPLLFMQQVKEIADSHGLPVHMDGARIANAAVHLGISCSQIAQYCQTISVCMSKSLCSPVGSVLCGPKEFIKRARRYRKVLGGGMRQVGHLTAACMISLDKMIDRLSIDHKNALHLANKIASLNSSMVDVNIKNVHTNIVMLICSDPRLDAKKLYQLLSQPFTYNNEEYVIETCVFGSNLLRLTFHLYITESYVEVIFRRISDIIRSFK